MKTMLYPPQEEWSDLCRRPGININDLENLVKSIISKVKDAGDDAIREFSEMYDGFAPVALKVEEEVIAAAAAKVPEELKAAIEMARLNIEKFHLQSNSAIKVTESIRGVRCWSREVPIEKVGLYIPGGTAPLFSTALMLAIPASLAGCREIILCSPHGRNGEIDPLILYAASVSGVTAIYRVGGAQAIAAMAYGTETVPQVYKIFGPGNQYVTKAKELVQTDGIAVDMPAGPSEVLIIADKTSVPRFVAADLLSQAEHGPDSQVIMLTDNRELIDLIRNEVILQVKQLKRKDIIIKALENSALILLKSLDDCIRFSNMYAPEHLIIAVSDHRTLADRVINAGSVFLGTYSCESIGDYASGPNHTLPTNGFAKSFSGVSKESFMKKVFFQEVTPEGIRNLGPAVELMAEAEMLDAHKNAVSIRLKSLNND